MAQCSTTFEVGLIRHLICFDWNGFNLHVHYYSITLASGSLDIYNIPLSLPHGAHVYAHQKISPAPCPNLHPQLQEGMSEASSPPGLQLSTNGSSVNAANGTLSLEHILGENHDAIQHLTTGAALATGWDEEDTERPLVEGYCVECEGSFYID